MMTKAMILTSVHVFQLTRMHATDVVRVQKLPATYTHTVWLHASHAVLDSLVEGAGARCFKSL